jgi:hypothetical protein
VLGHEARDLAIEKGDAVGERQGHEQQGEPNDPATAYHGENRSADIIH